MHDASHLEVRGSLARRPLSWLLCGALAGAAIAFASSAVLHATPAAPGGPTYPPLRALDHDEGVLFLNDEHSHLLGIRDRLTLLRQMAVLGCNGLISQSLSTRLDRFAQAGVDDIDSSASATTWRGVPYLDGTIRELGIARVQGGSDYLVTRVEEMTANSLGIEWISLADSYSAGEALVHLDGAIDIVDEQLAAIEGDLLQL